ncbi:FxSxx-COOH system tetratricopeptide repeat protein [Streptomyces phaeochromogenes]|uniref:FxSxx-COOH system tetratricopeptide repeat protein n=1 Tax=Streptomyces phaeochromogenes TaxID=1923 RepID=UPI002E123BF1|nr:FxSxx-COOH system tetratricopeptide repeat protein [Streptomyces phaeochromogenes]
MEVFNRNPIFGEEIPARNSHFTGREEELRVLRQRLASTAVEVLSQPPQAVFGLGGIGKTEIAAEYAHRYARDYDIVWWVRSEHEDRVRDAFVKLGKRLGLAHADGQRDKSIWAVMDELRNGRYDRWLLIFDNATHPEVVKRYLPVGRQYGHVIITSREQQWRRHTKAEGIEVTPFSLEETVEFLRKRVPDLARADGRSEPPDPATERARHADAVRLAEALDNLPIAAEHAAAYLAETGADVHSYLSAFEENAHALFSELVDMDYPHAVATTWSISRHELHEDALQLFKLCAFFSPEPVAEELFLTGGRDVHSPPALAEVLGDIRRFRQAVRRLHRFSLAKIDGKRNVVTVHRVVQRVTRGQLEIDNPQECEYYRAAVHSLLAATNPRNPDRESNDAQYDRSLQHLRPAGALDTDNRDLRQLVIDQVRRLHLRGGHEESLRLGEESLRIWREKLGRADAQVLQLAVELGIAMRLDGRSKEARDLNQETLELLTSNFGEDHEVTLICANSYGGDLRALGRFEEALELDLRLLPLFERVFLRDHPRTLNVRNNLGADYRRLGRFREAAEQDQLTYNERERALGPTDLRTLTSKDAISHDLRGCGEYDLSLDVARDIMTVLSERSGPENLDALNAQKSFAVALRKAGHYEEALEESAKAVQRYSEFLGSEHRYTLRAVANRVNDLRVADRLREAEELGRQVLVTCQKVDTPKGDITWAVMANLAVVLRSRNSPDEARRLNRDAVRGMTELFGVEHPFTLLATINLASDLAAVGNLSEAREIGESCYQAGRRVLGVNHPDTLAMGANLSLDRRATGDHAGAEELRTEVLRRFVEALTSEHPIVRVAGQRGRVNVDIEPY